MMNILIVDDDEYTIETIKTMVDWEKIRIDNVFSSTTVVDAKKIFEAVGLDIILCDIEMRGENGLDFVEWVRERGSKADVIFLTSFAEFAYAQRALQLQSREYILKPVQYQVLNAALEKAVISAETRKREEGGKEKWQQSLRLRKEGFWKRVVWREVTDPEEMDRQRQFLELPYEKDDYFLFLVVEIFDIRYISVKVEREMYDFILRNITEELLGREGFQMEVMLRMDSEDSARLNAILRLESGAKENYKETMMRIGKNYILQIRQKLDSIVGCYVGMPVPYIEIPQQAKLLFDMITDDVFGANQVRLLEMYSMKEISHERPELAKWEKLLLDREEEEVQNQVGRYFLKLEKEKNANAESLIQFQSEFHFMLMSALKQRNVTVSWLWDKINSEEKKEAVKSIHNMQRYVQNLCSETLRCMNQANQEESIVYTVKKYISEHCAEEITRVDLAKLVHMNPDYLSRLFRNETGENLSDYLTRYRIEKAKELLGNTNSPINQIACDVGYTNFSYFAKVFRKYVQCTPHEYRKKMKNKTT